MNSSVHPYRTKKLESGANDAAALTVRICFPTTHDAELLLSAVTRRFVAFASRSIFANYGHDGLSECIGARKKKSCRN